MTDMIQPSLIEAARRAGLASDELDGWVAPAPPAPEGFPVDAAALTAFVERGVALSDRLPAVARRDDDERAAAESIARALTDARAAFLAVHAAELYDRLTHARSRHVRLEQIVDDAAGLVPGLVPTTRQMEAERARPLAEKTGVELAQGLLVERIMLLPGPGMHLIESMLAPTPVALEHLAQLRSTGTVDLGPARVTRQGRAGVLELCNPRHLNAEDCTTLSLTESAVDLVLLDPEIQIGVFRGATVDHPRYAGQRIFGAGINLTHLYRGQIDFLFYLIRDLGYVNKLYRGLITDDGPVEKLWIAAVESYAIGGGCQLLHVVDHVLATRGSKLHLPARKEGIIPGVSNLRLPRSVGDRAARQAILSGREWTAGNADADLLIDEVVEPGTMDEAIAARVKALTSSGLVNAAANRRALRVGEEPLDIFRQYMALYAREQADCHLSAALVANLERHWNAAHRSA